MYARLDHTGSSSSPWTLVSALCTHTQTHSILFERLSCHKAEVEPDRFDPCDPLLPVLRFPVLSDRSSHEPAVPPPDAVHSAS
ncbi:unnamed protein product [Periconia digitata]|uniref:Uncharacterized protein n=1 Tax=Periconia digitata TaxID=1303443 RepID=A0A9W4UQ76_9PLEO|nr:unnamed protein product [Periconia digitata]